MALTTNLIGYYKFDSNSNDSVGSNNGTDTSISYASAGIIGNCATFNGTSSMTSLSPLSALTTSFTVNCWVKTTTIAAFRTIYTSGTALNYWRVGIDNTGKLVFTEDNIADNIATTPLATNTWTMATFVKSTDSGVNLTIYRNGVSNGTFSMGTVATPSGTAYFGSNISTNFWSGGLDECGLWSRALSGSEITQLYNGGAGLIYPFGITANPAFITNFL